MEINNINLRRDGDALVPCANPLLLADFKGWTPVATVGGSILAFKDREVALGSPDNSTNVGAAVRCVVAKDDSTFIVMTGSGAVELSVKGNVLYTTRPDASFPAVGMRAVAANRLSATVPRRHLSSGISSGALKKSDEKALTDDFCNAYRRLCSQSSAAGSAIQPAIARYRLAGHDGSTLFVSQPVLLMPDGGAQFCDYHAVYSSDGQTVNEYTVEAATWKLALSLRADNSARQRAAKLDVLLTPLFHPFDTNLPSPVLYGRYASATDVFARIALPGRQRGLGKAFSQNSQKTVRDAVAHLDRLETCIASVNDPFAENREISLDIPSQPDPETDAMKIARTLAKPAEKLRREFALTTMPNTFTASQGAAGASATMWANITAIPFGGYMPSSFAARTVAGQAWTATVAVRFRNGKGVVRSESGMSEAFTALSPLLCYPSPDAVGMTVQIVSGGTVRRGSFALSPDDSGQFSIYVSPGLDATELPVVASEQTLTFPDASEALSPMLAFAPSANPLAIAALSDAPGYVTALAARTATEESWEFGRSRFIAATASEIFSAGTSHDFRRISLRTLSHSGITGTGCICPDGKCGFFAIADGNLLRLGSRGATVIDPDRRYSSAAWNTRRNELWARTVEGDTLVFEGGSTDFVSMRKDLDISRFAQCGDAACAVSDSGIYLTREETTGGRQQIEHCRIIVPARYDLCHIKKIRIDMQASAFDGEITVEGIAAGTARPWLIKRCAISGSVAGPVVLPLISRPLRAIRLTISGSASSDFRLKNRLTLP